MRDSEQSPTDPRTVPVDLSDRSYEISIGSQLLGSLGTWIQGRRPMSHAVVITDSNTRRLYETAVRESLEAEKIRVTALSVPAGEPSKSIEHCTQLWEAAIADGIDRRSVVIAVGGGVIGDLAGFVAATVLRGVPFYQVPTTLLAQVDSSVGGKVGINLASAKNIVGAFWQPEGVLIDIDVLNTLPEREYVSGLAEVVKYGVILDPDFFAYLENNAAGLRSRDPAVVQHVVARSCELKADVVSRDERETTGLRAILNYGHTFCHALETVSGYGTYLHGEAVSIGMLCASRLGQLLECFDQASTDRQRDLLAALELPIEVPRLDEEAILAAMRRDKKVEHGKLRFIVPKRIGHVELMSDIPEELALAAWRGGYVHESG